MLQRGELVAVLIGAALAVGLMAGCSNGCTRRTSPIGDHTPDVRAAEPEARLLVFAGKTFYLERSEPEVVLHGVLRTAEVREGPNTRDMPFRLVVEGGELSVYVSGFDHGALRPYVDRPVEVVGKRIDQRRDGYGTEIWIGSITLREP